MKRFSLKIAVGITTLTAGIVAAGLWGVNPFSLPQNFDVPIPAAIETETAEEYAVYSTILNELFVKDKILFKQLVISNETFTGGIGNSKDMTSEHKLEYKKQHFASVSEEIFADYETKQTHSLKIRPEIRLSVPYTVVNAKEIENPKGNHYNSNIRLSRVGLNRERNKAFVTVNYSCPLCGFGIYLLLEKEKGIWKIKDSFDGCTS